MQNLSELCNDIIMAIHRLEYHTLEENLLKSELKLNIYHFLSNDYEGNIAALKEESSIEPNTALFYDELIFKTVTSDVINAIYNLDYKDKEKLVAKANILLNLSKLFNTQLEYQKSKMILNELERNKARKM